MLPNPLHLAATDPDLLCPVTYNSHQIFPRPKAFFADAFSEDFEIPAFSDLTKRDALYLFSKLINIMIFPLLRKSDE